MGLAMMRGGEGLVAGVGGAKVSEGLEELGLAGADVSSVGDAGGETT